MQKNWYILYTRPETEFRVSSALSKRKIENYCPKNQKEKEYVRKIKMVEEALFPGYVFVNITEGELEGLRKLPNVVSIVYWKREPAIVEEEDMNLLKQFSSVHNRIHVTKTSVKQETEKNITYNTVTRVDGNYVKIQQKLMNVHLPSMGFHLSAASSESTKTTPVHALLGHEVSLQSTSLS